MNHSAQLMKEIVIALGVASLLLVVGATVAVHLLRRKLVS